MELYCGKGNKMSYVAAIFIQRADESQNEIVARANQLIAANFSAIEAVRTVRVMANDPGRAEDFGIVEIDVMQSRNPEALALLRSIFMLLCEETNWGMELNWDGIEAVEPDFCTYLRRQYGTRLPVEFDEDEEFLLA